MNISNAVMTWLLLGIPMLLLAAAGCLIGGLDGVLLAVIPALGLGLAACCYSDRLILKMTGARELRYEEAPDVYRLTTQLALRVGLPLPRLCLMESDTPNAFATGRSRRQATIVLTRGLLHALARDELAAVLAYQLANIQNRDNRLSAIVAAAAGAITWFIPSRSGATGEPEAPSSGHGNSVGRLPRRLATWCLILLARPVALLINLLAPISNHFRTDANGAQILGDPLPLARALEKLELVNRTSLLYVSPGLGHQFIVQPCYSGDSLAFLNTHPSAADRASRLRALALQRM